MHARHIVGPGLAAALLLCAQQVALEPRARPEAREPSRQPTLRVETQLVLVPVSVNDGLNRPVSGLDRENFRLFDKGIEQPISQFAMDDEPVAVGLVFDTSGSMGNTLQLSRLAAKEFFRTANPEDQFFLVEFDSAPRLVVPLTSDPGVIDQKLLFSRSRGSTALLDAIYLALHEIHKSKLNKKALLVISDGGDNHSRYSPAEVRDMIRESDVLIYSIGVLGAGSDDGTPLLSQISEQTGGRLFFASRVELPDIALKIGIELRNRYVLGFSPRDAVRDGRYHRLQVKMAPPRGLPKLHAHWRTGYYAPLD